MPSTIDSDVERPAYIWLSNAETAILERFKDKAFESPEDVSDGTAVVLAVLLVEDMMDGENGSGRPGE